MILYVARIMAICQVVNHYVVKVTSEESTSVNRLSSREGKSARDISR